MAAADNHTLSESYRSLCGPAQRGDTACQGHGAWSRGSANRPAVQPGRGNAFAAGPRTAPPSSPSPLSALPLLPSSPLSFCLSATVSVLCSLPRRRHLSKPIIVLPHEYSAPYRGAVRVLCPARGGVVQRPGDGVLRGKDLSSGVLIPRLAFLQESGNPLTHVMCLCGQNLIPIFHRNGRLQRWRVN